MQYTGITRRIDELGRVVIPKEIRIELTSTVKVPSGRFFRK